MAKKYVVTAALSILTLAGTAVADIDDVRPLPSQTRTLSGLYPVGFPPARELNEVTQVVFDNYTGVVSPANNAFGGILGQGGVNTVDDLNFDPGPWGAAFQGTRLATSMGLYAGLGSSQADPLVDCDIVFDIFNANQLDYTNVNGMLSGTYATRAIIPIRNVLPGFGNNIDIINLTGLPGGGILFPSSSVAVRWRFVRPDADPDLVSSLMYTGVSASQPPPGGINPSSNPANQPQTTQIAFPGYYSNGSIGSSVAGYGRDHNIDGSFTGAPAPGGSTQERRLSPLGGRPASMCLLFRGDAPPPTPPVTAGNFGTLDCNASGGSQVSLDGALNSIPPVNSGDPPLVQVQWYQVTLPGDASVAAASYLDIFTADNSGTSTTYSAAIYNVAGSVLATDTTGTGFNAGGQLSLGDTAPRGNVGGADLDGRDGDLLLANNTSLTFYVAVSGGGVTFGNNYTVVTTEVSATGPYTLTLRHNLSASGNCPLPTPVAPTVNQDLGTLPDAATTTYTTLTGVSRVVWLRFAIDYSVGAGDPTQFLDIDTQGSDTVSDTEIGLFDDQGNLLGEDDNTGGNYGKSQLSFGGTVPRASGGPTPFAGQNGSTLPAGNYYLCAALGAAAYGPLGVQFGQTGWRARTDDSGDYLNVDVNFHTTIAPPSCPADYNLDGVLNADDIGDFITGYFNVPSDAATDFNADGVINADDLGDFITAYFNGC